MGRLAPALALLLVVAIGLAARLAPARERHLAAHETGLGPTRWLVDDARTALHLRRIELALAEGRVPLADPFLAFPGGAEVPALPVYDALLAGSAERWLAHADGDPALGGVDEGDLEAFAARIGPILALAGLAAVAWAATVCAGGALSAAAAAAAVLAFAPAAIASTEAGILDASALAVVLLALLARSTQRALAAPDALSVILEALLAGVVAGLLAAVSASGALLAAPTAIALVLRARRGPDEQRAIALRAGLLFALVAAFVARLPIAEGPWQREEESLVHAAAIASSDVLLALAAPFALLLLTARREGPRGGRGFARLAALAAMLALLVYEAPRFLRAASAAFEAWRPARELAPELALGEAAPESPLALFAWWISVPALAGLALAVRRAWRTREPAAVHLAVLALAGAALALVDPAFAPVSVACCALALAGALAEPPGPRVTWALRIALAVLAVLAFAERGARAPRAERLAFAAGLRWIRANVAAGGPFNSSAARADWGILVDPALGELVAYHARRPVVASRASAGARPDAVREGLALARTRPIEELASRMAALGLRVAVFTDGARVQRALQGASPSGLRPLRAEGPAFGAFELDAPVQGRAPVLIAPR